MAKKGVKKKGKGKKKRKKIAWKSIRVPEEIHAWLKRNATAQEKAMHHVIRDLIFQRGKQFRDIDKLTWYAFKLINGYVMWKQTLAMKELVDEDKMRTFEEYLKLQRNKFMITIEQIESRLGISLNYLKDTLEKVDEPLKGRDVAKLNDAVKASVEKILMKLAE